jgi:hypothetical protein
VSDEGGALGVFARRLDALTASLTPDERITIQGEYVDALVEAERSDTARGFKDGVETAAQWVEEWDVEAPSELAAEIRALAPANHAAVVSNAPCPRCGGSGLVMDGTVNPVACPGCSR